MKITRLPWSLAGLLLLALLLSSCQHEIKQGLNPQLLFREWGLKQISSSNDSLDQSLSFQANQDSIRFFPVAQREAKALPGQGVKAVTLDFNAFKCTSGFPDWILPEAGAWKIDDSLLILSYNLPSQGMLIDSMVYSSDGLDVNLQPWASGTPLPMDDGERKSVEEWQIEKLNTHTLVIFHQSRNLRLEFSHDTEIASASPVSWKGIGRGIIGMAALLFIAWIFSANRRAISWKVVGIGLLIQGSLAIGVLKVPFIKAFFEIIGKLFVVILDFTKDGSTFLLGGLMDPGTYGFIFMFQVLPTIIFFSALTSLLFYLGIIQKVVYALAWLLTKALKISGAESLAVAGNIFLGQTESPLMIKAYLEKMNKSEILLVMTGGMATMAGGVLAAYISFLGGDDPVQRLIFAKHLLAASVMAAPGAVVISKMLYPQREEIDMSVKVSREKVGSNVLDAISNGTTEGLKLAANVGAMLLVFIAFIAMFNFILLKTGQWTDLNDWVVDVSGGQYDRLSLQFLLGYLFAPIMWLIGIAGEDVFLAGRLLGEKIIMTEFIGYVSLAELKEAGAFTYEKSIIISTYMLCGFANFASIGIQIGGIGSLAPNQRVVLSEFGMRALLGGTLAALVSATMVGMILG
jgi:concentrative nucleoside transporter, CNT family